jgi:hypothetical protein
VVLGRTEPARAGFEVSTAVLAGKWMRGLTPDRAGVAQQASWRQEQMAAQLGVMALTLTLMPVRAALQGAPARWASVVLAEAAKAQEAAARPQGRAVQSGSFYL